MKENTIIYKLGGNISYKPGDITTKDAEHLDHVIAVYGFVLNQSKYRGKEVTFSTLADEIAKTYDLGTPQNAAAVKLLRRLEFNREYVLARTVGDKLFG